MELSSQAFKHEGMIPSRYTCDADDISPDLQWQAVPDGVQSFALICDDPDAPMGTWVHWVYFNIPPSTHSLPEGVIPVQQPDQGGRQGTNDFQRIGYGGPCPPGGIHRYYFKLFALDAMLDLDAGASKQQLLDAMEGRILAKAEMMGRYQR